MPRVIGPIVALTAFSALAWSATPAETEPKANRRCIELRVSAGQPWEWSATIRSDGSGDVGVGSSSGTPFSRDALNFKEALDALSPHLLKENPAPNQSATGRFIVSLYWDDGTRDELYTQDTASVAAVFEQFREAQIKKGRPSRADPPLDKAWQRNPPTALSKKWDDPIAITTTATAATASSPATRPSETAPSNANPSPQ